MYGIGIDFGTSNCAVALYDGEEVRHTILERDSPTPEVMPSALYLARDKSFAVGRAAIDAYVRDNTGRSIRLRREEVGEIEVTVAGTADTVGSDDGAITDHFKVHAYTDQELPGRLFRGVKRWLGNSAIDRVRVFDARYRIVALATPILVALQQSVRREGGDGRGNTLVGRPIHYEGRGVDSDRVAIERMSEACRHAGLGSASFHAEPTAAALSYLHGSPAAGSRTVMSFDFGGGTLDLCLMRARGPHFDVLATHGIPVGGDEIDRQICRSVVFPELGEGASLRVLGDTELRAIPFPMSDYGERLLNWMQAHELNRPELLEPIARGARQAGEAGTCLGRLYGLITGNYVFALFREIERAKVELSDRERATIELAEIDLSIELERQQLDELLAPLLLDVARCIDDALAAAGVSSNSVDVVVRTGGSSRIPAVVQLLEEMFPGRVVEHGAFTSIAAGLAIAAAGAGG